MFFKVNSSDTGSSNMARSLSGKILGKNNDKMTVSNNTIGKPIAPFVFVIANSATNPTKLSDINSNKLLVETVFKVLSLLFFLGSVNTNHIR